MNIKPDLEKLSEILRLFANVCNININIVDKNMQYIYSDKMIYNEYCHEIHKTEKGKKLCEKSDLCLFKECNKTGGIQTHICHAGLIDIAVPIEWNGEICGYIILGQMKCDKDFNSVQNCLKYLEVDWEKMRKCYEELEFFDYDKLNNVMKLTVIFSKYIIMENILRFEVTDIAEAACTYINNNFDRDMSIGDILKEVCTSPNTLYKAFRDKFECTPGEYINKTRVNKSVPMLLYTEQSIEEISGKVGFSDASYYSKVFKREYGCPPIKYRQQHKKL